MEYNDATELYKPNVTGNTEMLAITGYTSSTTKTLAELSTELWDGLNNWCSGPDLVDPLKFRYIHFIDDTLVSQNDISKARIECNRPPEIGYNGKVKIFQDTDVNPSFQYLATIDIYKDTLIATTFQYTMQFIENEFRDYTFNDIQYTDPVNGKTTILDPVVISYEATNTGGESTYSNGVDTDVVITYFENPIVGETRLRNANDYCEVLFTPTSFAGDFEIEAKFKVNAFESADKYIIGFDADSLQEIQITTDTATEIKCVIENNSNSDKMVELVPYTVGTEHVLKLKRVGSVVTVTMDTVDIATPTVDLSSGCDLSRVKVGQRGVGGSGANVDIYYLNIDLVDDFDFQTRLWANGDPNAYKVIGSVNSIEASIVDTSGSNSAVYPYVNNDPNRWYLISD